MKKALLVQGGWSGHDPKAVAERFSEMLKKHGYETEISNSLDSFLDLDYLMSLDLIVVGWTCGGLNDAQCNNISKAVASGVGLAGCHGGLCDAFRSNTNWQFITGGQWVAHPGGCEVHYTVNVRHGSSPIVEGISDFNIVSEQYYLHVDPAIEVLATTRFPVSNGLHAANKPIDMPVVWTKYWGNGRVFYNSIGHNDDVFAASPEASLLMERGLIWAGEGKQYALDNNLTVDKFNE